MPVMLKTAIREAVAAGLSVVPPRMDGSKAPLAQWREYQKRPPTKAEIENFYAGGNTGLGAVCGAVSRNLELFEFDDHATFLEFLSRAELCGLGPLVQRVRAGYEERTPSGGVHWLWRCAEIAGNTKLAQRLRLPEEIRVAGDERKTLIETRGEGGYVVLAPSNGRTHKLGSYELLSGGFSTITEVSPAERSTLFDLARSFNAIKARQEAPAPNAAVLSPVERPGDDYNRRAAWADVLTPAGWQWLFRQAECDYWRRPGKNDGVSATTNHDGHDLLYVFTTSTVLEAERGYSKFAAYTALYQNGDFRTASRALRELGYGAAPQLIPVAKADLQQSPSPRPLPMARKARDLQIAGLPEIGFAVGSILPEGVALCAGRPKQGKSFLALNLAIAVAAGGKALGDLPVQQGDVLYLTLEGGEHGFLPRLNTMLGGRLAPDALEYQTEWPRLDEGGADHIASWLGQHPKAKLIVIDTLAKVRPPTNNKSGVYEQDYAAVQSLVKLALDHHVAILLIHHTRKAVADDPLDTVSGSTGLTGAVDAVWVLQRVRGQGNATLTVSGRNIPDDDLGLEWDDALCSWRHAGEAADVKRSAERQAVLRALKEEGGGPMTAQEVADLLEREFVAVRQTMLRMSRSGELVSCGRAGYRLVSTSNEVSHMSQMSPVSHLSQVSHIGEETEATSVSSATDATGATGALARAPAPASIEHAGDEPLCPRGCGIDLRGGVCPVCRFREGSEGLPEPYP